MEGGFSRPLGGGLAGEVVSGLLDFVLQNRFAPACDDGQNHRQGERENRSPDSSRNQASAQCTQSELLEPPFSSDKIWQQRQSKSHPGPDIKLEARLDGNKTHHPHRGDARENSDEDLGGFPRALRWKDAFKGGTCRSAL